MTSPHVLHMRAISSFLSSVSAPHLPQKRDVDRQLSNASALSIGCVVDSGLEASSVRTGRHSVPSGAWVLGLKAIEYVDSGEFVFSFRQSTMASDSSWAGFCVTMLAVADSTRISLPRKIKMFFALLIMLR